MRCEQSTAISPINTLISAITKAKPKPILRLLPMYPTPTASESAMINNTNLSISFNVAFCIIMMVDGER